MIERVINELKNNKNIYISGQQLCEKLGVSRTAVWKYINQLRENGYEIESSTKKGYRLVNSPDILNAYELMPFMANDSIAKKIIYKEIVDSTNNYARKLATERFENGTLVLADEQNGGRGRYGRLWISPKGQGIWMSLLLKPQINPKDCYKATLIAACAVCRAIFQQCGIKTGIKWPNDIVINSKKICGILTEMNAEMDEVKYLIVGIGINANIPKEEFVGELADKATSLLIETEKHIDRAALAAAVVNEFEKLYTDFSKSGSIEKMIAEYKESSAVIGKQVRVIYQNKELVGTAVDFTKEGHLIIQKEDGSTEEIMAGEVSVRGIYGYI